MCAGPCRWSMATGTFWMVARVMGELGRPKGVSGVREWGLVVRLVSAVRAWARPEPPMIPMRCVGVVLGVFGMGGMVSGGVLVWLGVGGGWPGGLTCCEAGARGA